MKQLRICWHVRAGPASALVRHRVSPRVKPHQAPRAFRPDVYTAGTRSGRKACTAGGRRGESAHGRDRSRTKSGQGRRAGAQHACGRDPFGPQLHTAFLTLGVAAFVRTSCDTVCHMEKQPSYAILLAGLSAFPPSTETSFEGRQIMAALRHGHKLSIRRRAWIKPNRE